MKLALQFLILPALLFTASAALSAPHIHKEAYYIQINWHFRQAEIEYGYPNTRNRRAGHEKDDPCSCDSSSASRLTKINQ